MKRLGKKVLLETFSLEPWKAVPFLFQLSLRLQCPPGQLLTPQAPGFSRHQERKWLPPTLLCCHLTGPCT